MRKSIVFTSIILVAVCATVFLFSACTFFQDSAKDSFVLTGLDAQKFIESIRAHCGDTESLYEMGQYFQERKKHKLAITEFYKALECDPDLIKVYNSLGVSYDALGEHKLAVDSYNNALRIDPKLDYVLNNLGYSYILQNRPELAIESLLKAVALDDDNELFHNNMALAYANNGQYDAAFDEFRKGGTDAKAHYNIAKLYYQKGLFKEAKKHFALASLLEPSDPEAERALKAAGNLEKILAEVDKVPETSTENAVTDSVVQVIRYDDDDVYTIPARSLGGDISLKGKEAERGDETLISMPVNSSEVGYDDDGVYTIPPGALQDSENRDAPEKALSQKTFELPVQKNEEKPATVALIKAETREEVQDAFNEMLEKKMFNSFSELDAPELLGLQSKDSEGRPAPRIKIEVKNGNGVRRMARRIGNYLRGKGVILMYLSNAIHFNYEGSRVYYTHGYLPEAYKLAQKLPGLQRMEEVPSIKGGNAEISILIGRDLIPHDTLFKKG